MTDTFAAFNQWSFLVLFSQNSFFQISSVLLKSSKYAYIYESCSLNQPYVACDDSSSPYRGYKITFDVQLFYLL